MKVHNSVVNMICQQKVENLRRRGVVSSNNDRSERDSNRQCLPAVFEQRNLIVVCLRICDGDRPVWRQNIGTKCAGFLPLRIHKFVRRKPVTARVGAQPEPQDGRARSRPSAGGPPKPQTGKCVALVGLWPDKFANRVFLERPKKLARFECSNLLRC